MSNTHVMLDIEALGPVPNGIIASIGVAKFTLSNGIRDSRGWNILLAQPNREFNPSTVEWWLNQSKEAQNALLKKPQVLLATALTQLTLYLDDISKTSMVWANGVNYDMPMLRHAYAQCGILVPWDYKQEMCMRSIRALAKESGLSLNYLHSKDRVPHKAVSDAVEQALLVIGVFNEIKRREDCVCQNDKEFLAWEGAQYPSALI